MNEHKKNRFKVWMPLLFSIVLIAGMVLGFNLRDTLKNKRDIETAIQRNDRLEEIIDLINEKYVDTVDADGLYKNAVGGILKNLDPHTTYIPADQLADVNDNLQGGFFGIGVEFSIVRDTIEVTSVVENGPAEHAGVAVGDQLIKVGDTVVAGNKITSARIIRLLKGKQHSRAYVTMRESESGKVKQLAITRDVIPIYSIDAGLMLDNNTGFIKINRFSATTYDEFTKALKGLQTQGIKQLIIDLRENPGGYLENATSIADELLAGNKLIVYTQGAHSPKTEYRANEEGTFESGRVAVLVDESSASASEILAGAVQDWDRGIIIGRRTFGKGLVQEQYEMNDGSALRLTIARYFTPSGRCIQRTFAQGKDAYEADFEKRFTDGELTGRYKEIIKDTLNYYTSNRRIVHGGGGITPDIFVPYDTSRFSPGLLTMIYSEELKATIWDYYIHNRAGFKYKNIADFSQRFNAQDMLTTNYLNTLKIPERKVAVKILSNPANSAYFKMQIKAQVARFIFRSNGYYAISLAYDNMVQKALQVLRGNDYSKIIGR